MRTKTFFIILFLISGIYVSNAQVKDGNKWINKDAVLKYNVTNGDQMYDYIVDSLQFSSNLSFNWKMGEPINYSGKISHTSSALESATIMVANFHNNTNEVYTDRTAVFISQKVYLAMKNKTPISISINDIPQTLSFIKTEKYWAQKASTGLELTVLYAETDKGGKFWILDDKIHPIIIKMISGFTIELISVSAEDK